MHHALRGIRRNLTKVDKFCLIVASLAAITQITRILILGY